jgi:hypothetical protein
MDAERTRGGSSLLAAKKLLEPPRISATQASKSYCGLRLPTVLSLSLSFSSNAESS